AGIAAEGNCPADGFDFRDRRPGQGMIARVIVAARDRCGAQPLDDRGILGMQHDCQIIAGGLAHQRVKLPVIELEPVLLIDRIDLERGDAGGAKRGQFCQGLVVDVGYDQMQAVIDRHIRISLAAAVIQPLQDRAATPLQGEIDDGRRAATKRRNAARAEIIDRARTHEADHEVYMRIHTGGNDDAAARVDLLAGGSGRSGRDDSRDPLSLNDDIEFAGPRRGHHLAAANDQTHQTSSSACARSSIRSSPSSIPTEMRTSPSGMPIASLSAVATEKWDVLPGCEIRLSTPPMDGPIPKRRVRSTTIRAAASSASSKDSSPPKPVMVRTARAWSGWLARPG